MFKYINMPKLVAFYLKEFSYRKDGTTSDLYKFIFCLCLPFISRTFRRARLEALAIAECTNSKEQILRLLSKLTGATFEVLPYTQLFLPYGEGNDQTIFAYGYNETEEALVPFKSDVNSVAILVKYNGADPEKVKAYAELLIPFWVGYSIQERIVVINGMIYDGQYDYFTQQHAGATLSSGTSTSILVPATLSFTGAGLTRDAITVELTTVDPDTSAMTPVVHSLADIADLVVENSRQILIRFKQPYLSVNVPTKDIFITAVFLEGVEQVRKTIQPVVRNVYLNDVNLLTFTHWETYEPGSTITVEGENLTNCNVAAYVNEGIYPQVAQNVTNSTAVFEALSQFPKNTLRWVEVRDSFGNLIWKHIFDSFYFDPLQVTGAITLLYNTEDISRCISSPDFGNPYQRANDPRINLQADNIGLSWGGSRFWPLDVIHIETQRTVAGSASGVVTNKLRTFVTRVQSYQSSEINYSLNNVGGRMTRFMIEENGSRIVRFTYKNMFVKTLYWNGESIQRYDPRGQVAPPNTTINVTRDQLINSMWRLDFEKVDDVDISLFKMLVRYGSTRSYFDFVGLSDNVVRDGSTYTGAISNRVPEFTGTMSIRLIYIPYTDTETGDISVRNNQVMYSLISEF